MQHKQTLFAFLLFSVCSFSQAQNFTFHSGPPCLITKAIQVGGNLIVGTECGIYRSSDAGQSWGYVSDFGQKPIAQIEVAPDSTIWIEYTDQFNGGGFGNAYSTIWRSVNHGASFTKVNHRQVGAWQQGAGGNFDDLYRLVALDKNNAFLLGKKNGGMGVIPTLFMTSNGGQTWQQSVVFDPLLDNQFELPAPCQHGDSLIWLVEGRSLYSLKSTPYDVEMLPQSEALPFAFDHKIQAGNQIVVGTDSGQLWMSNDFCKTWKKDSLPTGTTIHILTLLQSSFLISTNRGVFNARYAGQQLQIDSLWHPQNQFKNTSNALFTDNQLFIQNNGLLFQANTLQNSVSLTLDFGRPKGSFSLFNHTDLFYEVGQWVFQGKDGKDWYLSDYPKANGQALGHFFPFQDSMVLASGGASVYRSSDNGATFENLGFAPPVSSIEFRRNWRNNEIYIPNSPFFTIDRGQTWDTLSKPRNVFQANGDTLLAANGISLDHGQTWINFTAPTSDLAYINGKIIYTKDRRLWLSRDFGQTWEERWGSGALTQSGKMQVLHARLILIEDQEFLTQYIDKEGEEQTKIISSPNEIQWWYQGLPLHDFGTFQRLGTTLYQGDISGVWKIGLCDLVGKTITQRIEICPSQNYVFFGDTLTQAGTYLHQDSSEDCGIVTVLHLNYEVFERDTTIYYCKNDSVQIGSVFYSAPTAFSTTLSTTEGCDSIINFEVRQMPDIWDVVEADICHGATFIYAGIPYTLPTLDTFYYVAQNGCDSVEILKVNVNYPTDTTPINTIFCEGAQYTFGGYVFTQEGTYIVEVNSGGCLYPYKINVTVRPDVQVTVDTSVMAGEMLFGTSIFSDTSFVFIKTKPNNCDTIFTVHATLLSNVSSIIANKAVRIFPNPSTSFFEIQTVENQTIDYIEVHNAQGKPLQTIYEPTLPYRFDATKLDIGVYFLKIKTQKGIEVYPLVKS